MYLLQNMKAKACYCAEKFTTTDFTTTMSEFSIYLILLITKALLQTEECINKYVIYIAQANVGRDFRTFRNQYNTMAS